LFRYLTEREKKLRLRRKHAEEIIAWKKKLDDEELQVREIEKKGK
jgi:centrosomal protein CEP350